MLLFYGDPHTHFEKLLRAYKASENLVSSVFLAGDQCPESPLEELLESIICPVRFILGNHDADREHWLENHFGMWNCHLHCCTHTVNGLAVAGLSGVFREKIWHPAGQDSPRYNTRQELKNYQKMRKKEGFHGWLPRKHWASIFPENFNVLSGLETDILFTHEAPSVHKYGFSEIDELAELMGAQLIIHGHHHERYSAVTCSGIKVIGLDKQDCFFVEKNSDGIKTHFFNFNL